MSCIVIGARQGARKCIGPCVCWSLCIKPCVTMHVYEKKKVCVRVREYIRTLVFWITDVWRMNELWLYVLVC